MKNVLERVLAIASFRENELGDSLVSEFEGVKWVKGSVVRLYPHYCIYTDKEGKTQSIARHSAFISEEELIKCIKGTMNSILSAPIFFGQDPNPRQCDTTRMLSRADFEAAKNIMQSIESGTFYKNYYHPDSTLPPGFGSR